MSYKLKSIVIFLKFITDLLLLRNFGNKIMFVGHRAFSPVTCPSNEIFLYTSNSYKIYGEKKNKLQKRYRREYAHHINPAAYTNKGSFTPYATPQKGREST